MTRQALRIRRVAKARIALREAARAWVSGLRRPVVSEDDRAFAVVDEKLQRAAVRYADALRGQKPEG